MPEHPPLPPYAAQVAADNAMGRQIGAFKMSLSDGRLFKKFTVIHAFENGCVLSHHSTERTEHFRWDDVDRFTQEALRKIVNHMYHSTKFTCEFDLLSDRQVKIVGVSTRHQTSALEGFIELADPLIASIQLPRVLAALENGEPVDFGFFTVDAVGVHAPRLFRREGKVLPWAELGGIWVESGTAYVRARGRRGYWSCAEVSMTPNFSAFHRLIQLKSNTVV